MIGNIIISSHAFHFGLREDILDEKSWSWVRFEPMTSRLASRHANHWATELRIPETVDGAKDVADLPKEAEVDILFLKRLAVSLLFRNLAGLFT